MKICTREAEQCELSDLADSRAAWAFPSSTQIAGLLHYFHLSLLTFRTIYFFYCLARRCQWYAFCQSEKGFSMIWHEVADSMTDREMMARAQHDRISGVYQSIIISTLWDLNRLQSLPWSHNMSRWGFDPRTWPVPEKDPQGAVNALCSLFGWNLSTFSTLKRLHWKSEKARHDTTQQVML